MQLLGEGGQPHAMPLMLAAVARKKVAASAARQRKLHCSPTFAWLAARVGFSDEEEMSCPLLHHAVVGCFIPMWKVSSAYEICRLKHGISSRDIIHGELSHAGSLAAVRAAGLACPGGRSVARTRSPKAVATAWAAACYWPHDHGNSCIVDAHVEGK
ncbi:hypothetical protein Dimus_003367 [Dionaea muscipula]